LNQLLRIVQATAVNAITVYGVFGAHWTVATAIALYWAENVIGIVLIAALFVIHRIATHKRGHYRGVLKSFLLSTTVFTIAHGVFLAFFLLLLFPKIAKSEVFDPQAFRLGLKLIAGVMLFTFVIDALLVKNTPFATIRGAADSFMPRVLVVHLTIIFGLFAMAVLGHPRALFAVFAALKFGADLLSRAPKDFPEKPPGWLNWIASRSKDPKMIEKWRQDRAAAIARMADDELVHA
jgi:hypothetical protein